MLKDQDDVRQVDTSSLFINTLGKLQNYQTILHNLEANIEFVLFDKMESNG